MGLSIDDVLSSFPEGSRLAELVSARVASRSVLLHPAMVDLLKRVLVVARPASEGTVRSAVFDACERAFIHRRVLRLAYTDARGVGTERDVEPHGFLLNRSGWCIVGLDRAKGAVRTFRLDRVRGASLSDEAFTPVDPRTLSASNTP